MRLQVKVNQETVNIADLWDAESSALMGDLIRERIQRATRMGYGVDGGKFKPYSQSYADEKGVAVDEVNLADSGEMMRSIVVTNVSVDGSFITIEGEASARAIANNRTRPFMALTEYEVDRVLVHFVRRQVAKKLDGAARVRAV